MNHHTTINDHSKSPSSVHIAPTVLCRCCGMALRAEWQDYGDFKPGGGHFILTCDFGECPMRGHTLSQPDYDMIDLSAYSETAARLDVLRTLMEIDSSLAQPAKHTAALIRFDRLFRIYEPAFIKECQTLYIRLFSDEPTEELAALA